MDGKELGGMAACAAPGQPWIQGNEVKNPFDGYGWMIEPQPGITLRQHFAGLAMQGLIAAMSSNKARNLVIENADKSGRTAKEQIAFAAVEYADALLAELSKESDDGR